MRAGSRASGLSAGATDAREVARGLLLENRSLHVAAGQPRRRAAPVRIDTAPFPPGDHSAEDAFAAVLALYAPAIGENLRCVLTETDPEGAHQLRVSLRRLRTMLRVFKPVIRRTLNQRLAWVARYLGAIVGELRDADVMIDDLLRPAALPEEACVLDALDAWREEARARVRASLLAARATAFANDLLQLSESGDWRRGKSKRRKPPVLARTLVDAMLDAVWARAQPAGERLAALSAAGRHDLRKDIKALRYGAELAAAVTADPEDAALVAELRRVQDALGQLNDLDTLQRFDPLGAEKEGLSQLRQRLAQARCASELISAASSRWRGLAAFKRLATSTPPRL